MTCSKISIESGPVSHEVKIVEYFPSGQKYLMSWMRNLTIILFHYLFEHICKSSKYKIIEVSPNRDLYILKVICSQVFSRV